MSASFNKKILIVEDELPILRALVATFTSAQFEVYQAKDGEEGLAAALEHHPDLIILDIIMPKMDGLTMLRNIRENGDAWGENVNVIVYTNLSYNEKREEARKVGVANFLIKANVPLADLVHKVEKILKTHS